MSKALKASFAVLTAATLAGGTMAQSTLDRADDVAVRLGGVRSHLVSMLKKNTSTYEAELMARVVMTGITDHARKVKAEGSDYASSGDEMKPNSGNGSVHRFFYAASGINPDAPYFGCYNFKLAEEKTAKIQAAFSIGNRPGQFSNLPIPEGQTTCKQVLTDYINAQKQAQNNASPANVSMNAPVAEPAAVLATARRTAAPLNVTP